MLDEVLPVLLAEGSQTTLCTHVTSVVQSFVMLLERLQHLRGGWEGDGGTICSSRSCAVDSLKPEGREKLQTLIREVKLSCELFSYLFLWCDCYGEVLFPKQSQERTSAGASCLLRSQN